jgi:3-oxoacyl-[acyl-carrier protein] reductase
LTEQQPDGGSWHSQFDELRGRDTQACDPPSHAFDDAVLIIVGLTGGLGSGLLGYFDEHAEASAPYGTVVGTSRQDFDLQDPASVETYFAGLAQQLGPEPIHLVNAAGVSLNGYVHKQAHDDWQTTLEVNLSSAFVLVRALHPLVRERPGSSILLLSSVVSETGVAGTAAYAASKAGIRGFVRSASRELARHDVRINCLELGYFDRGMINQVTPEFLTQLESEIPLGRLGTVDDLFFACDFALRCRYLTGGVIKLNGGLT